jgi:hypothetical protein
MGYFGTHIAVLLLEVLKANGDKSASGAPELFEKL